MTRDSIPVWALRTLWLVQPVTLGPALADGLHDLDGRTFLSVAVWVLWGLGLLATLVPRPVTLTAIRIGGPAAAAPAPKKSSFESKFQIPSYDTLLEKGE